MPRPSQTALKRAVYAGYLRADGHGRRLLADKSLTGPPARLGGASSKLDPWRLTVANVAIWPISMQRNTTCMSNSNSHPTSIGATAPMLLRWHGQETGTRSPTGIASATMLRRDVRRAPRQSEPR